MTDISSIGMVSYYNPLAMYRQQQQQHQQQQSSTVAAVAQQQLSQQAQQHVAQAQHVAAQQQAAALAAAADTGPSQQYWYGYPHGHPAHAPHHHHHHHQTTAPQQYLEHAADVLAWPPHPHSHHYSHHLQYQHHSQAAYQQHQQQQLNSAVSEWSGDESSTHHHQQQHQAIGTGEPSPPITVSGSEISSPGTPSTPPANNNNNPNATNNNNNNNNSNNNNNASTTPMRPSQIRSPYEWMKKPSYQSQPNPACNVAAITTGSVTGLHELCTLDALGKTRTKDKYRVVYTDHQRLELEKEFHYSRYITIRRKAELAANLALSERQVKIWFQNRRAKERKQSKKREELEHKDMKPGDMVGSSAGGMASLAALGGMSGMLGGLMHNGGSPPLSLGPPSHHGLGTALGGHPASSIHAHNHQHAHSHAVLGL